MKFHIAIYLGKYFCLSCLPINPISANLSTHLLIFTKWNWNQNTSLKWCVCKALEDYENAHWYMEENEMKQNFFRKLKSYFIVVQQILNPVIRLFLLMTFIRKQIKNCVYRDSYTQMFTITLFLHKWKIKIGSLKVNNF